MSRPPVMPSAYGATGFCLIVRSPSPILDWLEAAGADVITISELEIESRISEAVARFLDARQHAVSKPEFRPQIKELQKILDALIMGLPGDYSPLACELEKHWQYGPHPARHWQYGQFKSSLLPIHNSSAIVGTHTPIAHLRAELLRFSSGLQRLGADIGVGQAGRVEVLEEHEFVGNLAALFMQWTDNKPSQGIKEAPLHPSDRVTGLFFNFVRDVLKEARKQIVVRLHRQGKIVDLGTIEPLTLA